MSLKCVTDFQKPQTPNRKAARASASTPQTARGFANLSRNSKKSPNSKLTPASRKRLSDSYTASGKVKGHMTDRLTLKRKAMATLTAKRNSPKKKEMVRKLKTSVSDGVLVKRKVRVWFCKWHKDYFHFHSMNYQYTHNI